MSDKKRKNPGATRLEDLPEYDGVPVSEIDLATMDLSEIVYVKSVTSEQMKAIDGEAFGGIPDGLQLFAVHTADGVPVALLDDRDTAFAAARQYEMRAVSVH